MNELYVNQRHSLKSKWEVLEKPTGLGEGVRKDRKAIELPMFLRHWERLRVG